MKKARVFKLFLILLVIAVVVAAYAMLRPLPPVQATPVNLFLDKPAAVNMPWPASGQAAYGTLSDGLLASHGDDSPVPTASVAKIITALAVLRQKPLQPGDSGPTITLGPNDVELYEQYYSEDGSVVAVASGEQITEYQALEAMLLPSANNMADSLAGWAFGSVNAYASYANNYVKSLGMSSTHVADASGFSPQTVSTAIDLIKLAQAAMNNPVLAAIVKQGEASVPVAGTVRNVNWLLGNDGVVGIKTGNTDQAGGCFLFAANRNIQNNQTTIIGAIAGDSSLNQAISDADKLILAGDSNFRVGYISAGQPVAIYKTAWGTSATAVAQKTLRLPVWNDKPVRANHILKTLNGQQNAGTLVGDLQLSVLNDNASTPVVLKSAIQKPPISWRLTHFK